MAAAMGLRHQKSGPPVVIVGLCWVVYGVCWVVYGLCRVVYDCIGVCMIVLGCVRLCWVIWCCVGLCKAPNARITSITGSLN